MTLKKGLKSGRPRGRPRKNPQPESSQFKSQAPAPAPAGARGSSEGSAPAPVGGFSSGLRIGLDEVKQPVLDPDPTQEADEDGGTESGPGLECRWCGRHYPRQIARHEGRCPMKPEGLGQVQVFLSADGLELVFGMLGDAAAGARGAHWRLSKEEKSGLAGAWKQALDLLVPDLGNSKWTVLILALANTAIVLYPRLMHDATIRKAENPGAPSGTWPGGNGQEHAPS